MRSRDFIYFIGFVSVFLFLIYYYLYRRYLKYSGIQGRVQKLCNATFFLAVFSSLLPLILFYQKGTIREIITWSSYTILGFIAILLPFSFGRDLISGSMHVWNRIKRIRQKQSGDQNIADVDKNAISRRDFIIKSNYALLTYTTGSSLYGISGIHDTPAVYRSTILIPDLPDYFSGFTIVQISDIHVGPQIKRDYVARVVERVNELQPDIIALTGDLVDGSVDELGQHTAPLVDLYAPYGKYFSTGNHEYYSGVEEWLDEVERLGLKVLMNSNDIIRAKQIRNQPGTTRNLVIAGVPDCREGIRAGHDYNPVKALRGTNLDDIKILMAHQPVLDAVAESVAAGYHLQLSGHTHGGLFFPYNMLVNFVYPYNSGLYNHEDKIWVYVNRGTGFWGPPFRIGVPSEITHLTLTNGKTGF